MLLRSAQFAVLVVLVDIAFASISNGTIEDVDNKLDVKATNNKLDVEAINKKLDERETTKKLGEGVETRRLKPERRKNTHRSTSSSSGEKKKSGGKSGDTGESLEASTTSSSSSENRLKKKHFKPKSSAERRGWRKWHRKCTPCPEEMSLKWRDQRIKWICGAYQRARRSFKSMCMMHYRNCQDGTMFTKIHDHRCAEDIPEDGKPHGEHFFYDYKVRLSADSTSTGSDSTSSLESSVSDY